MNDIKKFQAERLKKIKKIGTDAGFRKARKQFMDSSVALHYTYNFDWCGLPIIQYPQDIVAMQELIWKIKPDLIIETGVARGGSIIFYASMLELLGKGEIVGIDIDIRPHNRKNIEKHKFSKRITLIQGSSTAPEVVAQVKSIAKKHKTIMVVLDSLHTHDHALGELHAYAGLVNKGSYCVVFDTVIEDLPAKFHANRPWGPGNNPKTAVKAFLKNHKEFAIDREIEDKIGITVAPSGYLKRIR